MRNIFKGLGIIFVLLVFVSLFYYVRHQKEKVATVAGDKLVKDGQIAMQNENYPNAIALFKRSLTFDTTRTDIKLMLGRAYVLNGNFDTGEGHFLSVLNTDRDNPDALRYLINASLLQHDTVKALAYLGSYSRYHSANEEILMQTYILSLQHGDYAKAEDIYKIYTSSFNSEKIRGAWFDFWENKATQERKQGDLTNTYESYTKAIRYEPNHTEVLQQLVNITVKLDDYIGANTYNNRLLDIDSSNLTYLSNASFISSQLGDKRVAALHTSKAYSFYPSNSKVKGQYIDFYLAMAKNEMAGNKIRYANIVLQADPTKKEALLYAINGYINSAQYQTALNMTDRALSYYPSDQLFIDKKVAILTDMKEHLKAATFMETVLQRYPTNHNKELYRDIQVSVAKNHTGAKEYNKALDALDKGLVYNKYDKNILQQQLTIYVLQGATKEAIQVTERLLVTAPGDAGYLFKKAAILESNRQYEKASDITYALHKRYPFVKKYSDAYIAQLTAASKMQLAQHQWDKALALHNKAMATGAPGYFSLVYALTAYSEKKEYQNALLLTDKALTLYPGDSMFTVKKFLLYNKLHQYDEGFKIGSRIMGAYPADTSLEDMYLDQLITAGMYYKNENNQEKALEYFAAAYEFAPEDTFVLQRISAAYFEKSQYDSSIMYANLGLAVDKDNEFLLLKKASSYEKLGNYKAAYQSAHELAQSHPGNNIFRYAGYLQNKTLKNQIGISHLQSFFSSPSLFASVTGIEYTRRFKKLSLISKVNLGQRQVGVAAQGGLEAFYKHSSSYYSNAQVSVSDGRVFPYLLSSYSLFRNFQKGWEAELGARYIGFSSITNYVAVASIGKYFNSTWVNFRGFYIYDTKNWHPSYLITARQYLNDKNDYISAIAGIGRQPDDKSLVYNFEGLKGYRSKTVGVGFQKSFGYKTALNTSFNFTNLKSTEGVNLNQYDVFVRLTQNF